MSIDGFFNDILSNIEGIVGDFTRGDPEEANRTLQNQLGIRLELSAGISNAPNQLQGVVAQQAFDAASVIERQLAVLTLTRQDYQDSAEEDKKWLQKVYNDLRSHGTYFQRLLPEAAPSSPTYDEPYLNIDGDVVFDE